MARSRRATPAFPRRSRSRQPSVFSVLRALGRAVRQPETDQHLGLYGAFGYDLVFQFEPMQLRLPRPDDQRDLVLYLPDEILIVDHMRQIAAMHRYEFEVAGRSTARPAARDRRRRLSRRPRPRRAARSRATTARANMPRWSSAPRRRSSAAICSRSCAGSSSPTPAPTRRASSFSGCARPTRRPTAR